MATLVRHCRCEECSSNSARLVYRLDPRNLKPVRRRLCLSCSKARGFEPVSFARPYSGQGDGGE